MQQLNEQGEKADKYQGKHCWCAEKLITSGGAVIQNGKTLCWIVIKDALRTGVYRKGTQTIKVWERDIVISI